MCVLGVASSSFKGLGFQGNLAPEPRKDWITQNQALCPSSVWPGASPVEAGAGSLGHKLLPWEESGGGDQVLLLPGTPLAWGLSAWPSAVLQELSEVTKLCFDPEFGARPQHPREVKDGELPGVGRELWKLLDPKT